MPKNRKDNLKKVSEIIEVEKQYTVYRLTNDQGEYITAEVGDNLTLKNDRGKEEFVFIGSDKKRVSRICSLISTACDLK